MSIKNFIQAKKYLYSLIPGKRKPGLFTLSCRSFEYSRQRRRMKKLMQALGNPHKKFRSIHVAGTSGKGSTCYLISNIVRHAVYKTGLHVSPHLEDIRERMQINGKMISKAEFVDLVNEVKQEINKIIPNKFGIPSYFEALMAMAFLYFAKQKVDLAVVETGCGGRYDSSNVLQPEIAIITNIGLDHCHVLGNTHEQILKEKMQIIKPGCKCAISGITQSVLQDILRKHCQKTNVPLNFIKTDKNIMTSLRGEFQKQNASLACAVANNLNITQGIINKAFLNSYFPGRFEIVQKRPLIILDGAHNPDKMRALVKSIKKLYLREKFTIIFGLKKDRKLYEMIKILQPITKKFIITQFGEHTDLGEKFSYPANELYKKVSLKKQLEPDSKSALSLIKKDDKVLITGSLYLIGEIKKILNQHE